MNAAVDLGWSRDEAVEFWDGLLHRIQPADMVDECNVGDGSLRCLRVRTKVLRCRIKRVV